MDPLATISTRRTPQSHPADGRQVPNAAGGHGFKLADDVRIHRFLTLGTTGGTYYASEQALTKATTDVVLDVARTRGEWLVEQVVAISTAGRAPKQDPAIFALAAVAGLADETGRKAALTALPLVCRTGTHLFLFARYVEQFRGWGRALRRAVGDWYDRDVEQVAYQVVKYRQREGWTHRDLLRLAHPETEDARKQGLYEWIVRGTLGDDLPDVVRGFVRAQVATTVPEWVSLIKDHPLSWEMLPDVALSEPAVWRALIDKGVPQTALMRQLPRLTKLDVLNGDTLRQVTSQLASPDRLRNARVHPINVLVAARTYASGRSARGDGEWRPKRQIIDALDAAFYAAFAAVEPTGKRTLLALDVSGSMTAPASGLPISCRETSAALALVTMAIEPDTAIVGFTSGRHGGWSRNAALTDLPVSPRQRLDDAIRAVSNLPFGGTDCSLPMRWATDTRQEFDVFQVYTDNETWAGPVHPHQALVEYRERSGIDARLAVVGMSANDVSIADPSDIGMLDVAGFDSAAPTLLADFARGDL